MSNHAIRSIRCGIPQGSKSWPTPISDLYYWSAKLLWSICSTHCFADDTNISVNATILLIKLVWN
jgi:hypothetical protein